MDTKTKVAEMLMVEYDRHAVAGGLLYNTKRPTLIWSDQKAAGGHCTNTAQIVMSWQ